MESRFPLLIKYSTKITKQWHNKVASGTPK